MKKTVFFLSFAFAFAVITCTARAADDSDPYLAFEKTVAPIQQELYVKQNELSALYNAGQRDDAKVQQLFREIGELKGKLFTARSELQSKVGSGDMPYAGYGHHGRGFGRGSRMGRGMGMGHGMGMSHHGAGSGWW